MISLSLNGHNLQSRLVHQVKDFKVTTTLCSSRNRQRFESWVSFVRTVDAQAHHAVLQQGKYTRISVLQKQVNWLVAGLKRLTETLSLRGRNKASFLGYCHVMMKSLSLVTPNFRYQSDNTPESGPDRYFKSIYPP